MRQVGKMYWKYCHRRVRVGKKEPDCGGLVKQSGFKMGHVAWLRKPPGGSCYLTRKVVSQRPAGFSVHCFTKLESELPDGNAMPIPYLHVSLNDQQLRLQGDEGVVQTYSISTARNGPGERYGSGCTPRGWHVVRAKIGTGCPLDMVFVGRRPTGERYSSELAKQYPQRDWILTRILWLGGCESGRNRGGMVDTLRRFIYIHGSPASEPLGVPGSHGCIRMSSSEIVELFEQVKVGTRVFIGD